ncbi:MAG: AI-2E family transporter [Aquabacterium sp.]
MDQPANPRPPALNVIPVVTSAPFGDKRVARVWPASLQWLLGLAVLFLLKEAQAVLLPIAVAVTLTLVLTTPVQRLRQMGIPQAWGAGLVVTMILLIVGLLGLGLAGPATQWLERVPATLKQWLDTLDHWRQLMAPKNLRHVSPDVAQAQAEALKDKLTSEGLILTRVVVGQFVHVALSASATVILLYFLLVSQPWLLSRTIEAVKPSRSRVLLLSGIRQAQREIGLYLGTMLFINIGLGAFTGVALALIGLPNPVLWGTMVATLTFIPYLGPALLTGLLLLGGSMTFGTGLGMLAPPVIFLGAHAIEASLLSPWIQGHRLRLSPLAVFLSVMLWGWIWGLGGTLVAVPILLCLRAFCRRREGLRRVCLYLEGGDRHVPSLQTLLKRADKPLVSRVPVRAREG